MCVLLVGVALATSACPKKKREAVAHPPGKWVKSQVERDRSPEVTAAAKKALITGNNAFALDAYQVLRQTEGNVIYSPLSVSMAMAMVYAGARGDTAAQMATALHYRMPEPNLHQAFNWLDLALAERGRAAPGVDVEGFRLDIANALFLDDQFEPRASYLATLGRHYGTGVALMDFAGKPGKAREQINAWVSKQTGGRIEDLLAPSSVGRETRMVLTNAVYFKAAWQTPFDQARTAPGVFHAPGGDITVPMMRGTPAGLQYAAGEGYQAIALPYQKGDTAMVILLPPAGGLEALESDLTRDALASIVADLAPRNLGVTMPRFSFRFDADMGATLREMGMKEAFTANADLSGITGSQRLRLSAVAHEAFIDVSEAGTEAAAATGAVIAPTSLPRYIEVDRPFVFFIYDRETGSVVFLGRVVRPS